MRPTTRRTLATSMRHQPVTRDLRPRQLPTVPSHAVPTRECQSDPPSLLRTLRCSRPRGTPLDRASPLDLLLHVRASKTSRRSDDRIASRSAGCTPPNFGATQRVSAHGLAAVPAAY